MTERSAPPVAAAKNCPVLSVLSVAEEHSDPCHPCNPWLNGGAPHSPRSVASPWRGHVVVHQVIAREEHGPVAALPDVRLAVDCGANIGVSSYIPDILARAHAQGPIDLITIDIEGAETEVFRVSPPWRRSATSPSSCTATPRVVGYAYSWADVHESTIGRGLTPRRDA